MSNLCGPHSIFLKCPQRSDENTSSVAQRKRAGPITQRSVDRNHSLLSCFPPFSDECCAVYRADVHCQIP
ncbi:unnamed protein product [Enterobius vermicularis]|uniref:Uncharacterized protein n=1 Tax=Enterobius vermicularis TaxID=51028 RepID=A0A0N4V1Y6_ENTVE|nr:unnamed protein product [Enterobius vermicularis]